MPLRLAGEQVTDEGAHGEQRRGLRVIVAGAVSWPQIAAEHRLMLYYWEVARTELREDAG